MVFCFLSALPSVGVGGEVGKIAGMLKALSYPQGHPPSSLGLLYVGEVGRLSVLDVDFWNPELSLSHFILAT